MMPYRFFFAYLELVFPTHLIARPCGKRLNEPDMYSSRKNRLACGIIVPALSVCILAGCTKDEENHITPEPPVLNIDKTEFTLGAAEDMSATITFDTNVDWTASVTYEGERTGWLDVSSERGGSGDNTITVTAEHNISTSPRTACIDIGYGTETRRITILQELMDASLNITEHFYPTFAKRLKSWCNVIDDENNITFGDVASITEIDVSHLGFLESLGGIEYLISLKKLECYDTHVVNIDVSNNTALTYLDCSYNYIEDIDISRNTALTHFDCSDNDLTSLDISRNTALTYFNCSGNPGKSGKFTVTAWFGNDDVPEDFTTGSWNSNGQTVEIEYVKAE